MVSFKTKEDTKHWTLIHINQHKKSHVEESGPVLGHLHTLPLVLLASVIEHHQLSSHFNQFCHSTQVLILIIIWNFCNIISTTGNKHFPIFLLLKAAQLGALLRLPRSLLYVETWLFLLEKGKKGKGWVSWCSTHMCYISPFSFLYCIWNVPEFVQNRK